MGITAVSISNEHPSQAAATHRDELINNRKGIIEEMAIISMIVLFIIFVFLLPVHSTLETSETGVQRDMDADGQSKSSKEIGKDFSESRFSMSHANGENKTVMDDIIRLNNLSLQAFYKMKREGEVPKFGFLVRARKNTSNLETLYEGDMALDEKDLAVMGMFVMPSKEEVAQFSGPNDEEEESESGDSEDDEEAMSKTNPNASKTKQSAAKLLQQSLKVPPDRNKASPSKSFLKTFRSTQTITRTISTQRSPTPTSRRTSVTSTWSTRPRRTSTRRTSVTSTWSTRTRRTSTQRSPTSTPRHTMAKTMEPSSSLDFLSLVNTKFPLAMQSDTGNQNYDAHGHDNQNGNGDKSVVDRNARKDFNSDNPSYDTDNNDTDGAGDESSENDNENENQRYIEIGDDDEPLEVMVNPTSSPRRNGNTKYSTLGRTATTHYTSTKHSTIFRTSKPATIKSPPVSQGGWDDQPPPQTSLLLPTQNQWMDEIQPKRQQYHQQQQQLQQQNLESLAINTYKNETALANKRSPFVGLVGLKNKMKKNLKKKRKVLKSLTESQMRNPFLKDMKKLAAKNAKDPKMMKYNVDIPSATPLGRKLWVSRVVPYYIKHKGTRRWSQAKLEKKIISIMNYISAVSCVQFRRKTKKDKNALVIIRGSGCYADIGRKYWIQGGMHANTRMSIGDWCTNDGIIMHLLLHVLGFFHESNRPDRDSFVSVDLKEVLPDYRKEFRRHYQYDYTIMSTPYDFRSILHYSENAYDVRPNNDLSYTLTNVFDRNEPLGGTVLTKYNILAINKLYHCGSYYREANRTVQKPGVSNWAAWSNSCLMINDQCVKIRQRQCLNEDLSFCPTVDKFGVEDQFMQCSASECETELLIPHWSNWGPLTPICSKTCGRGIWTQRRKCNNPKPINSKYTCVGHNHRSGICRVHKCNPSTFDTDFEDGWGTWSRNFQYSTLWNIIKGPSEIRDTGSPDGDHTIPGNGSYAILQARDPFKHMQKVGELISQPVNTSAGPKCLVFYFVMNGKSVKSLQFYLRVNNKYHKVWSRTGHQGNYWQRGGFSIPQVNFEIQVVLDGVTGLANTSDIAVDDFQLNNGSCPVGIEGCFDYFQECKQWRIEGLCVTEFEVLIFSCCKTCQYEEYKDVELKIGENYKTVELDNKSP